MSPRQRALCLIGSAKEIPSTSESLGNYLLEQLRERGFETGSLFVHKYLKSSARVPDFLAQTRDADLLIIAAPLYVDSLPYLVTRALELIAEDRRARPTPGNPRLLCIMNSGFPEPEHSQTAIAICRRFARETGFTWAGGLTMGAGEAICGRPLPKVKRMARNVIKALDLAADALAAAATVPPGAVELMAKPLVGKRLFIWLGHLRWKRESKAYGVRDRLDERPYPSR